VIPVFGSCCQSFSRSVVQLFSRSVVQSFGRHQRPLTSLLAYWYQLLFSLLEMGVAADVSIPVLLTPKVCSSAISPLSPLALVIVEAVASCSLASYSSVIAWLDLVGHRIDLKIGCSSRWES
jgi:hypothetical protein